MADVMLMNEIAATAPRIGIDLSQLDLDSIRLPPGDNFGVLSDDDSMDREDKTEPEPESDSGFGNIIVIENLPLVPLEKFEKLENVIRKILSRSVGIDGYRFWMPVEPQTRETLGYCFIEYKTRQEAELAKERTHGIKLDKSHVFFVCMLDEFDRFMNVPDQWAPPELKPYEPGENLHKWLTDEKARDQLVIRAGLETEVLWNDARYLKPELVHNRKCWTDTFVQWSPLGTYLATVHCQGALVWGGSTNFNRLMRYAHPEVRLIDFSPGEKYLVTYSSQEPSNPRDTNRVVINIFDVRTGKVMRDFKGTSDDFAIGGTGGVVGVHWPIFKWAGRKEDKYFARMGKNVLSVYETETFSLVGKQSMKVENIMDFSWSPTEPILALFVPEMGGGNQPARVSLVQIPAKEELRQKNLFSVSDCKMYWQSNGEYLAVKFERYTKTKKSTHTGFELFRIKERDIPIEVLELENKNDKIIAFAWEPKGHRFAVIHYDDATSNTNDVSFYSMRSSHNTGRISKLTTLKGKAANALLWSPSGRFIILAGLKGLNGKLEFYDVDEHGTMATAEHYLATDIEWDPTGRYVATSVTSVHGMENGFNMWSLSGKLLYKIQKDHFFQLSWRPRPPTLLSPEKEEEIAKNLRKYSKKYEAEDHDASMFLSEQERERRWALKEEWEKWVAEWKLLEEEELKRQKLIGGESSDEKEEYVQVKDIEVEEVLNVEQEDFFED